MKRGLVLLLTCYIILFRSKAEGQSVYQLNKDSLEYFLQKKDLVSYFNKIKILASIAADTLMDQFKLDSIGKYLLPNFEPLTPKERGALRYSAMIVGRRYSRNFGDYEKALQFYLIANQNVEDKEYLDGNAWYIENEIFNIYTRKGDYQKADYYGGLFEKSIKHRLQKNPFDSLSIQRLSRYYTNLGIQRRSQGMGSESFQCYTEGYNLAESIQFPVGMYSNAMGFAEYYLDSSMFKLSDQYLHLSGQILDDLHADPIYKERRADFIFLTAQYFLEKGQVEKDDLSIRRSIPLFKSAIDSLRKAFTYKERREFAKFYSPLAEAYLSVDSLNQAEQYINLGLSSIIADYNNFESLPNANQLYAENSFIELFKLQSQLYQKRYNVSNVMNWLAKSLQSIELGLRANDIIREQMIADPSKLITIRANKMMIHDGLKIIYDLYSMNGETEYLQKARGFFNRSKALLLDEKIRRHRLMDQITPEDSIAIAELQMEIRDLHGDKFMIGINVDSLNRLILVDEEKMGKLFAKYKEALHPSETQGDYIEYSVQDEDIFVLSSINGIQKFLKLGDKDVLTNLLKRMDDFILLRGLSEDVTVLGDLYHFLVEPIAPNLPQKIVIIPDGEIGFIPFDMLEDLKGKSLIEYCTISYAYEYETYSTLHEKTSRKYQIYCLAPTYKVAEKKEDVVTRGSIYQLPFAQVEADSIRKLFGTGALISDSDDKNDLAKGLQQAAIFHFAGHAIVQKDNAYLVMSSDSDPQKQLTEQEIALLPQCADLVVLSACETGLGEFEIGEGIRSLGRSFIESGASSTVISLWNVNDKSTSMIMSSFYKYLYGRLPIDESLRKAKLEYISIADKINQHPYFWAAFIPAGDMNIIDSFKR